VEARRNLLIVGRTGVGKTFVACALAVTARVDTLRASAASLWSADRAGPLWPPEGRRGHPCRARAQPPVFSAQGRLLQAGDALLKRFRPLHPVQDGAPGAGELV